MPELYTIWNWNRSKSMYFVCATNGFSPIFYFSLYSFPLFRVQFNKLQYATSSAIQFHFPLDVYSIALHTAVEYNLCLFASTQFCFCFRSFIVGAFCSLLLFCDSHYFFVHFTTSPYFVQLFFSEYLLIIVDFPFQFVDVYYCVIIIVP